MTSLTSVIESKTWNCFWFETFKQSGLVARSLGKFLGKITFQVCWMLFLWKRNLE